MPISWIVSSALDVFNRKEKMSNVIAFPGKDDRQWAGIAQDMAKYLAHMGAAESEISEVIGRLRPRWEQLGTPFDMQLSHTIPGPLTAEQGAAFETALRDQAAYISKAWKAESARTLIEFAKLELALIQMK